MKSRTMCVRGASLLVAGAVTLGATSCGTIFYPERRGQSGGRIDVGVAAMDGIGLLFFLVPGIIAFAVDFATGAIYLPHGSSQLDPNLSDLQDAKVVQAAPAALNSHQIEALVEQETGQQIHLASAGTKVARPSAGGEVAWRSMSETLTPRQLAAFENRVVRD